MKLILIFILFLSTSLASNDDDNEIKFLLGKGLGGPQKVTDEASINEALELLNENINQLSGGKWKLKELIGVDRQIVSGVIYKIEGKFEEMVTERLYNLIVRVYYCPWMDKLEGKFTISLIFFFY